MKGCGSTIESPKSLKKRHLASSLSKFALQVKISNLNVSY